MVSLLLTLKPQFRVHEIIFLVPEMKMTFTELNVEQTLTCTVFIPILLKFGMKLALPLSTVPEYL